MVRTFQLTKALSKLTTIENMKLGATGQIGESFLRALVPGLWRRQEAEIEAKASGAVTSNPNLAGNLAGSDYALKGTIKDRVLQGRDLKSVYYLVTFELTDLATSELVWTNEYETKFVSEKSVISR